MNQIITTLTTNTLAISAAFGIMGGLVRASIDFAKFSFEIKRKQKLELRGLLFCYLSLILIGAFMGVVLNFNWALSILGGYAAQDILDVLYKSVNKIKITHK